jgi:hypothetical protein
VAVRESESVAVTLIDPVSLIELVLLIDIVVDRL